MKKILFTSFLILAFCGNGFSAISDKRMNPFTKKLDYVLPVVCGEGEIAKVSSGVWTCSADASSVGGGNSLYVSEASTSVFDNSAADMTINFGNGFDFSGAGQARTLSLDYSEDPVALGSAEVSGVLGIASGGTNATTASDARTSLGLAIGTNVQAYDEDLTTYAGISPSANVQSLLGSANYAAMRALLDLEAGTDFYSVAGADAAFQPLDSDLTSWAGVTRASGFDTFTATPSSANLASLLTDEVGNSGGFTRGTAGATDDCVKWDANGNLVSAGAACGSGSGGDNVSVNGGAVVDPNFTSTGGTVSLTNSSNTITFNVNWTAVPSEAIDRAKINWSTLWTDSASGINWGSFPGSTVDYVLKKTATGVNWQADQTGAGGGDEVSIDGVAVTNPNFASTGQIDFVDTSNTVTANINDNSFLEADLKAVDTASDEDILTYESTAGDFEWHTISEMIALMTAGALPNDSVLEADLKAVDAASDEECLTYETTTGDFEWQACGSGSGSTALNLPIYSAKITGTFAEDGDATQGAQIDAGDGNWRLLFDATTDEGAVWQFVMPDNYTGSPALKIKYSMTSGTANEVEFEGAIMCVTPGDSADIATASFSSIAVASDTVPGTAGYLDAVTITLTDDSCAAADQVWIYLSTDADDATNDDATGDREVVGVEFDYA